MKAVALIALTNGAARKGNIQQRIVSRKRRTQKDLYIVQRIVVGKIVQLIGDSLMHADEGTLLSSVDPLPITARRMSIGLDDVAWMGDCLKCVTKSEGT